MYGRYKPFKMVLRYEGWKFDGSLNGDYTDGNDYWTYSFYNPRRHYRIPSDENIYSLHNIKYGGYYDHTLWALYYKIMPELVITNLVRYDDNIYDNITAHPTFGRYTPSRDIIHHELWRWNGTRFGDYTNINDSWGRFYYARRHKNVPNDENIYSLHHIFYGVYTSVLWALTNEIILDIYEIITSFVIYANGYAPDYPMYGRYYPFKDLFYFEVWNLNGNPVVDYTYSTNDWWSHYYARRHQNLPEDEKINSLHYIFYGSYTDSLWAL